MQPLKSVCLVMAQELGLLPAINEQSDSITAAEVARKVGSDEQLIGKSLAMPQQARYFSKLVRSSHYACLDWGWHLQ